MIHVDFSQLNFILFKRNGVQRLSFLMKVTVLENLLCWEVNKMFFSNLPMAERGVIP